MFHLSTKLRYGIRALVELARRSGKKPVSLVTLSSGQDISQKYLESIFRGFQKAGITRSVRGPKGGYLLNTDPDKLTVMEIMKALEGPLDIIDCLHDTSVCGKTVRCCSRKLWGDLETCISGFLESRTLKDLIEDYECAKNNFRAMNI